jgi:ribokinase
MVVVFGSINLDLVAQVARMPLPGETVRGQAFATAPGGKGANQALAAARAGAGVMMFGAVGRDEFGAAALANLEAAGVDLAGVIAVDAATGIAMIHVDAHGENAITIVAGANAEAFAGQVPDTTLRPDAILLMQLEVPLAEVAALAGRARGTRIVLNAAPALELPEDLLRMIDTLVVNESEAAFTAAELGLPEESGQFAVDASERYGCTVVVSMGSRGALAAREGELVIVAAPAMVVVDTTGAGDALVGAYAAALDRGASLRQALTEGVAAGSLACTRRGAQAALPTHAEIAALAATL